MITPEDSRAAVAVAQELVCSRANAVSLGDSPVLALKETGVERTTGRLLEWRSGGRSIDYPRAPPDREWKQSCT